MRRLVPCRFGCDFLNVSVSGYYAYKKQCHSHKDGSDDLCRCISEEFIKSGCTYGSPRIHQMLKK